MLPDPDLVRDDDNDDDDMMMTLTRWGMTFESLVLLTMAEEHLANSRHDSGDNWKPIKVHIIYYLCIIFKIPEKEEQTL